MQNLKVRVLVGAATSVLLAGCSVMLLVGSYFFFKEHSSPAIAAWGVAAELGGIALLTKLAYNIWGKPDQGV